jgi:hypothetical protein
MTAFEFSPDRVAYCEVAGWRAYYDHNWPRLLRLVVELVQTQFNIPFPMSLVAAYYVTRASAAWVPVDHDDTVIQAYNEKFYRLARRYSGLKFDPAQVAALETRYWEVHRRLSGKPDKTEFIDAMIALHSAVFHITPNQARESAELRVMANNVLDTITSRTSPDPDADWKLCEDYLRQCYESIEKHLRVNTHVP